MEQPRVALLGEPKEDMISSLGKMTKDDSMLILLAAVPEFSIYT